MVFGIEALDFGGVSAGFVGLVLGEIYDEEGENEGEDDGANKDDDATKEGGERFDFGAGGFRSGDFGDFCIFGFCSLRGFGVLCAFCVCSFLSSCGFCSFCGARRSFGATRSGLRRFCISHKRIVTRRAEEF